MLSMLSQSATKMKPLHCHAPAHWDSPSTWSTVRLEPRILASRKTNLWTPACFVLVTAAAVRSSGSVWFCLLGGCKQSGRHGPSLPCLLVMFCNVFYYVSTVTVELWTFWWDKIIESSELEITFILSSLHSTWCICSSYQCFGGFSYCLLPTFLWCCFMSECWCKMGYAWSHSKNFRQLNLCRGTRGEIHS